MDFMTSNLTTDSSTSDRKELDPPVWADKCHLRIDWGPYFWSHSQSPVAERQSCKHRPFRSTGHRACTLVLHNHCKTDTHVHYDNCRTDDNASISPIWWSTLCLTNNQLTTNFKKIAQNAWNEHPCHRAGSDYSQCTSTLLGYDLWFFIFYWSGQAKIGNLCIQILVQQNVAGFYISMNDFGLRRCMQII